ncbi:MAG: hypothetical protein HY763_16670 [Planctomycetes bacterium]|nr:hypothetical protein [Planctomycetota bacterium]
MARTPEYDHAGNLIKDTRFVYVYDAWNRLVKVRSANDADGERGEREQSAIGKADREVRVRTATCPEEASLRRATGGVIQTAEYDGTGRRMQKVVSNSGEYDKTETYLYEEGWKIAQINDGSGNMVQQFIHGTQYIDEVVMMRVRNKGDLYLHQDANWNIIAATDLGGAVVERYVYTPYGELTVHQLTSYGDRDGDQDVDSTDKGTVGTTCTGTVSGACRIVDLDFDGDYDSTDAEFFDNLTQGAARRPGRVATAAGQPFGHQGLFTDGELTSNHQRTRRYNPSWRTFAQRDPSMIGLLGRRGRLHRDDGLSLYSYEGLSPVSLLDAFGLYAYLLCSGYEPRNGWGCSTCCYASNRCRDHLCRTYPCDDVMVCGDGHISCPSPFDRWPTNPHPPDPDDDFCLGACIAYFCIDGYDCSSLTGGCRAYCGIAP